MTSSSTWTKRRSLATRSISTTAACGSCIGTRIEARSRGSRSSNSLATQSFTAAQSAAAMSSLNSAIAPCSGLQIAKRVPNAVERLAPHQVEIAARAAGRPAPVRPGAQRRVRRVAGQVEAHLVDVTVGELIAPVRLEIGQQRRGRRQRGMQVAIDRAVERNPHGQSSISRSTGRQALRRRSTAVRMPLITSTSAVATTIPVNTPTVSKFWRECSIR